MLNVEVNVNNMIYTKLGSKPVCGTRATLKIVNTHRMRRFVKAFKLNKNDINKLSINDLALFRQK